MADLFLQPSKPYPLCSYHLPKLLSVANEPGHSGGGQEARVPAKTLPVDRDEGKFLTYAAVATFPQKLASVHLPAAEGLIERYLDHHRKDGSSFAFGFWIMELSSRNVSRGVKTFFVFGHAGAVKQNHSNYI